MKIYLSRFVISYLLQLEKIITMAQKVDSARGYNLLVNKARLPVGDGATLCLPYFPLSQCEPFVRSTLLQLVWTFRLKFISYATFGRADSSNVNDSETPLCVTKVVWGERL